MKAMIRNFPRQLAVTASGLALIMVCLCAAYWRASAAVDGKPNQAQNTITVTNLNDSGSGSLRKAIADAADGDTIDFDPGLTASGPKTITLTSDGLWINKPLTISGPGADLLTLSGNHLHRVLFLHKDNARPLVRISGLTIADGNAANTVSLPGNGGGILSDAAAVITDCVIKNCAAELNGGGIINLGTMTVRGSTIANNTCESQAGGISNFSDHFLFVANLDLINTTVSGNAAESGGGLYCVGDSTDVVNMINCTMTGNRASNKGGGILREGDIAVRLLNTVVAGNAARTVGPDINGPLVSQGHNVIGKGDGGSGFSNGVNGDRVGTAASPLDARLASLMPNGGPTPTHVLLPGSPAIDAGDGTVVGPPYNISTDQRGRPRLVDGNGDGTIVIDIGAFEARRPSVVTNTNNSGTGSLRQAIFDSRSDDDSHLIAFSLPAGPQTITLTSGELVLDKPVIISGPGADRLTITANAHSRLFNVSGSGSAYIEGLTLSGGQAAQGGGVNNAGTLTLAHCVVANNGAGEGGGINSIAALALAACVVTDNVAANAGGGIYSSGSLIIETSSIRNNLSQNASKQGGGIFQTGLLPLEITDSTIANNVAAAGGGLYFLAQTGTLTNCTLSGNRATGGDGGAIENAGLGGRISTLDLLNCTIANNTASHNAVLTVAVGLGTGTITQIKNTLVAGNSNDNFDTVGGFTSARLISLGHNLDSDGTSHFTDGANGDRVGGNGAKIDARLGPLQDNGGPTSTHALMADSPALDAGASESAPAADQRGFARVDTCDIGAYEAQFAALPDITWTGNINSDWNNPGNWLPAFVPLPTSNVLINGNPLRQPRIINSDVTVNTLIIKPGVLLSINSPHILTAMGNVNMGGTFTGGGGATFIFKGARFTNTGTMIVSTVEFDTAVANLDGGGSFASSVAEVFAGTTLMLQSNQQMSTLAIFNGATVNLNGHTLSLSGAGTALSNDGVLMTAQGTVIFNGTVAQTIGIGGSGPYDTLVIDNPAGVALGTDVSVTSMLALADGNLITNQYAIRIEDQAGVTRNTGYVIGNLSKHFSVPVSFVFPVGTANGYTPVTAEVRAVSAPVFFTVTAHPGPEPHVTQTGKALQRYWTLAASQSAAPGAAQTGAAAPNAPPNLITANLIFNYLDSDVPATVHESSFVVTAYDQAFSSPGGSVNAAANTATVSGVNLSSSANWTLAEPGAPTAVDLIDFTATAYDSGTVLQWRTGFEANNLGFNVYREMNGRRRLANPQLVAGSALAAGSVATSAGRAYLWWDAAIADCGMRNADCRDAVYWLEDIDLNGERMLHGPITPQRVAGQPPATSRAALLSQISGDQGRTISDLPPPVEQSKSRQPPGQWPYASRPAIKLTVREAGWYRVTQPELIAAGLDPKIDPRRLQLYLEGNEQPILVAGESDGRFDSTDAVEFYGTGQETPETGAHVYWLVVDQVGQRIHITKSQNRTTGARSLAHTIELKERSLYFSALLNGDAENFFGRVISTQAIDEAIPLTEIDADARSADVEVALQGVTDLPASPDHIVGVLLNGAMIGRLVFDGREHKTEKFSIYASLLKEGDNLVTLTAEGGAADISLLDHIRITYQRRPRAEQDALRVTASRANGPSQAMDGFTSPLIRVFDVTEPTGVEELAGAIDATKASGYQVTVDVSGNERTLLAVTDERIKRPAAITANSASSLAQPGNGANLIVLTRPVFMPGLEPLVTLRRQQGLKVALVDVEDVYDEFNYGEKSAAAIRAFLGYASTQWKVKPGYVLFAGEASYDARDYLGLGDTDLVPTKLIDTPYMETASDDWLADFDNDGAADLRIGRLPMRTAEEAAAMVAKIVGYDGQSSAAAALLVADQNEGYDFEAATHQLRGLIPAPVEVSELMRGQLDAASARAQLLAALAAGPRVVNYSGHGSLDVWRGNLLTNADALGSSNGERLSVFVMMTCLNGYFHDPALDSLAESLLKAERGGAVAVWASSGMTQPAGQTVMNQAFYRLLFGSSVTLGEAAMRAKAATGDRDIRRTWILFGDPTMRLR